LPRPACPAPSVWFSKSANSSSAPTVCFDTFFSPQQSKSLTQPASRRPELKIAPESKRIGAKLTALFSLDGLLTDALVAYWFFRRFAIGEESLGFVFFEVHVLNAVSHRGAAWLARHIGLLKTTHLPSSLFLVAVPFAPSFKVAILLFLCREALEEMHVPTRQSYLAALVLPNEQTFASGLTNLVRNVFWAVGSSSTRYVTAMQTTSVGTRSRPPRI